MSRSSQDKFVGTRITSATFEKFVEKLESQDITQSEALREMIDAFVENRLRITPTRKRIIK